MTCIVGVQDGTDVFIGGDSAGVAGYNITVRSDQKVFRNGPFVMGFTSSFRMGQLLRYSFVPPKVPDTGLDKYMVVDFINAVRTCLKAGGWAKTDEGMERGGTFLVGVKGQLFLIDGDYQVAKNADGYASVGCGEEYALGSLHTTTGQDPKTRVRLALQAASHHSSGVTGPYTILKTKG